MNIVMRIIRKISVIATIVIVCQPAFAVQTGEVVGKHIFGLSRDYQGDPIIINDDPLIYKKAESRKKVTIEESVFEVSLFDNVIGGIYLTKFANNSDNYLDTRALDLSQTHGVSQPVAPIVTNWGSVLFSEERLVDTADHYQFVDNYKAYYKNDESMVNPYNYGWINELVIFDSVDNYKVIKNYAMGRVSASKIIVMPDNRTFYLLDTNHSGNVYIFVADKEKTMTRGALYVMSVKNGRVEYLKLGEGSSLKMKFRLKQVKFEDVFSYSEPSNAQCPSGFSFISTVFGEECLKVNSRYKKYAGKLEPIRVSALSGVSTFTEAIRSISLDEKSNKVIFKTDNRGEYTSSLTHNSSMNSDYIAEVLK
jgi:hypothetical protein